MMKPSLRILALWSALSGAAFAQKGAVGILDLDEVARVLKVDQAMMFELRDLEKNLNSQLDQHRQEMQSQMKKAEEEAGPERTPEVQQQLLDLNRKLNRDFDSLKNQAGQQLNALRIEKTNRFRRQLEPIAREAAKANGLEVILTRTPQVFLFPQEVDLTMEVIERARAAGLEAKIEVRVPVEPASQPAAPEEKTGAPQEIKEGTAPEAAPAPAPKEEEKVETPR